MKRRIASYTVITVATLLLAISGLWVSVSGQTQQPGAGQVSVPGFGKSNAARLPKGGPPPRTKDGHVDLSGVWFAGYMGREDLTAES